MMHSSYGAVLERQDRSLSSRPAIRQWLGDCLTLPNGLGVAHRRLA